MYKILTLFLIILLAGCQKMPQKVTLRAFNDPFNPVYPGAAENDGTGYTLRNAVIQYNTTIDSVDKALTYLVDEVHDTVVYTDVTFSLSDTIPVPGQTSLMTDYKMLNFTGGGTQAKNYKMQFITDETVGAPESGDSAFIDPQLIGMHAEVAREGNTQYQNPTGTPNTRDGFRFNSETGQVIFRPIFGENEQVIIVYTNTILWEEKSITGQESDLLTYLKAYWAMDEVTGSLVNDSHTGNFDGTSTGTTEPYGKLGYTRSYTRTLSHYSTFDTSVGDMGTDDFSVCAWIYVPTLQSATCAILGNWGDQPYYYLMVNASNYLQARFNFTGSNVDVTSDAAISASAWVHVALTVDRSGNATMYVNGVAQADVEDISAYSATAMNNNNNFSMGRPGDPVVGYYFHGYIDEIPLFQGVTLSPANITTIYKGGVGLTYPFNE